jgi:hypothetical protein
MRSLALFAFAILGVITALVLLAVQLGPSSRPELERLQPERQRHYPAVSNRFRSEKEEDAFHLYFEWPDHQGDEYVLDFLLPDAFVTAAEAEFGYIHENLVRYVQEHAAGAVKEMIAYLRDFALKRISKSKYSDYFYIEDTGNERFNLKITIPGSVDQKLQDKIRVEFRKIAKALEKERGSYLPRLIKEENKHRQAYLQTRGLRLENDQIMVDYDQVVQKNRARVQPLVDSLGTLVQKKRLRSFISVLLAYVQSMDYGTPQEKEGDKIILGFWPPPKVLIHNLGDCDSKAVAFAAAWLHFKKYPLLFITIPNHMFIGIAVPSFRGENVVINGLRYTFCEVTGPALIPAGLVTRYSRLHLESGNFRYEQIR